MKVKLTIKKERQAKALNGVKYQVPTDILLVGKSSKQKLSKSLEQNISVY